MAFVQTVQNVHSWLQIQASACIASAAPQRSHVGLISRVILH